MNNESGFQRIPPAPDVLAQLYAEYLRKRNQGTGSKLSFKEYLARIGFVKKEEPLPGRDMGRPMKASHSMQLVSVPKRTITGRLNVLVLLVDFDDNPAFRPKREYEDMLFSNGSYLTGSLRDYYKEVSNG
ncbi:MAG: hypothetical protein KBF80_14080, partial [Flavobacteriales bacterium]|nr:hypothetical protein [Flavobacteriales bacterium]